MTRLPTDQPPEEGEQDGEGFQPQPPKAAQPQVIAPQDPLSIAPQFPFGGPMGVAGMQVQQVQIWQGQFPPPDVIERYEALHPGIFGRLVMMAEKQQDAQISLNTEGLKRVARDTRRGHLLGAGVAVASLIVATICAYLNQPLIATAAVAVPVMGVARSLIETARAKSVQPSAPQVASPPDPRPAEQPGRAEQPGQ